MTRRRRRYRAPALATRTMTFGPALALPLWGWSQLDEPLHWYGLGVMALAALLVIPAFLLVVFFLPTAWTAIVPADRRKRYRQRHGREGARSAVIPAFLRRLIYAADRHQCVACGSGLDLQVDHYFPWSLGGLTVIFNLLTLCGRCNRVKSNFWVYRKSGRHVYVPFAGSANSVMAAEILAREKRCRRNPLRLLRAAWALG